MSTLVRLEGLDVALRGTRVLSDLDWRLEEGESWALLGANGAGKSTLMRLIRGDLWPEPGRGTRIYSFDGQESRSPIDGTEHISLVSAENQTRYVRNEWSLTGLQVVCTGLSDTDLPHPGLTDGEKQRARRVLDRLDIGSLGERNIRAMSQGELRKILIARALVREPRALLLDEVCAGLDAASRADILHLVDRIARSGVSVLLSSHRIEEMISAITHALYINDGEIEWQGRKCDLPAEVAARFGADEELAPYYSTPPHPSVSRTQEEDCREEDPTPTFPARGEGDSSSLAHGGGWEDAQDKRRLWGRHEGSRDRSERIDARDPLLSIRNADVVIDGHRVLSDINWSVHRGEHWLVTGANGAGKSTLLRLVVGDLLPVYGGEIERLGGTEEHGIQTFKSRVGFVSSSLQDAYRHEMTAEDVVVSGFFSTVGLIDEVSEAQRERVNELVAVHGLSDLAGRSALRLSYGQVRRLLLARALVHDPELLLLDEPFDGLDYQARMAMAESLATTARGGTSVVLISHHEADALPFFTHVLKLGQGRVLAADSRD